MINHKEKAIELVEKFKPHSFNGAFEEDDKTMELYHAKQCAIIHCNLMIDFLDKERIFEEIKNFNLLKNEINNL